MSLIIRLGRCLPRWGGARSASFRGDGWILWEISRPWLRSLISLLLTVEASFLSPTLEEMYEFVDCKHVRCDKLISNLRDKTFYVTHYRSLKFYLAHGMRLVRTHRIVSFTHRLRNDLYCVEWGVKLYSLLLLCRSLSVHSYDCLWNTATSSVRMPKPNSSPRCTNCCRTVFFRKDARICESASMRDS